MSRIAWIPLMRLGIGRMGLLPDVFWALTPAEFLLMAGLDGPEALRMSRSTLERLSALYPDAPKGEQVDD
jgi:uncharacterized phage protein (TIGR02216 family)